MIIMHVKKKEFVYIQINIFVNCGDNHSYQHFSKIINLMLKVLKRRYA